MEQKNLLIAGLIFLMASENIFGQKPIYPKPNSAGNIPFGNKLPAPQMNNLGIKNYPGSNSTTNAFTYQSYLSQPLAMSHISVPNSSSDPSTLSSNPIN